MNTAGVEYHNIFTFYLWWIVIECDGDGISRGYTGHEMLPEFGIINMNGRLYDPLLGRFFSPDNYVQLPDFAQSYNRYSYCLNNPLKYTDPSGELFGIDDAVFAFAAFNVASSMMQAAANGQNIWKAGAFSLLSSAASFGIGQLFGSVGSIGKELLRAGAHGIASGIFNVLGGGDFGNGFAAGATASGLGSFAQGVKMRPGMMVLTTSVAGGVAAWATGGNFLKGALQGLTIGFFNHYMHGTTTYYSDSNGNIHAYLPELVCEGKKYPQLAFAECALTITSDFKDFIENTGKAFVKFGENSTLGNNGNFYFHTYAQRQFYGNQYVKTTKLTILGDNIVPKTKIAGRYLGAAQLITGASKDYLDYRNTGYTDGYNTFKAAGGWAGAWTGAKMGFWLGGELGACFEGVGAIPGAIIGSVFFGCLGGIYGADAGEQAVDYIYEKLIR